MLEALGDDDDFKKLTPTYRYVIVEAFRRYGNGEGSAWFYQEKLAADLRIAGKTIQRALTRAKALGILSSDRQHWADSGRRTNDRYQLAERFVFQDKGHVSFLY